MPARHCLYWQPGTGNGAYSLLSSVFCQLKSGMEFKTRNHIRSLFLLSGRFSNSRKSLQISRNWGKSVCFYDLGLLVGVVLLWGLELGDGQQWPDGCQGLRWESWTGTLRMGQKRQRTSERCFQEPTLGDGPKSSKETSGHIQKSPVNMEQKL